PLKYFRSPGLAPFVAEVRNGMIVKERYLDYIYKTTLSTEDALVLVQRARLAELRCFEHSIKRAPPSQLRNFMIRERDIIKALYDSILIDIRNRRRVSEITEARLQLESAPREVREGFLRKKATEQGLEKLAGRDQRNESSRRSNAPNQAPTPSRPRIPVVNEPETFSAVQDSDIPWAVAPFAALLSPG
ncbi:MAG: hypothetical protein AAFU72_08705, partial [Pseudomonadota bacterium]